MLVQKDKILEEQYRSGSVSPKRIAQKQYQHDPNGTLPLMRRQQYAPEDITTAEVLTRVSQKD